MPLCLVSRWVHVVQHLLSLPFHYILQDQPRLFLSVGLLLSSAACYIAVALLVGVFIHRVGQVIAFCQSSLPTLLL